MKNNLSILSSNLISFNFLNNNNLAKYFNYHSIASRNIHDSSLIAKQYGFAKYYGSYEEVIENSDIDIVINFLPNSIKFEYSYLLLKKGKKVITNYPLFNSNKDIKYINEIMLSKYSKNLFLVYDYDYSRLVNLKSNNLIYTKFNRNNSKDKSFLIDDLLFSDSPDLFFLLNHFKDKKINTNVLSIEYENLQDRITYLNMYVEIESITKINIIINNISGSKQQLIISGDNLSNIYPEIIDKSSKVFNHVDLLLFINKNKTFENSTFFQYYPYKLFNEVINV